MTRIEKPEKIQKTGSGKSSRKPVVLGVVLGLVLVALGVGAYYAFTILNRPHTLFNRTVSVEATPTAAATPIIDIEAYLPSAEPGVTPMPTLQPVAPSIDAGTAAPTQAPASPENALSGIVNIALFGIDAFEDGSSTSGTMPHTDANMIVAINFDTKEVSLISIGRDNFTVAPEHSGFYKFNGIFNVGGGMDDPKAGFALSCRAAETWLGGISVPYYYGVDFQALIDLVDAIGGIDYTLDIAIYDLDGRLIAGRGSRHLDGHGVMAYLRMRRSAEGADYLRTARQRKMMIAIFKKLKAEGKLSMIPDLLKTMGDNVYTNTTLSQTVALVNFARNIDLDSIQSYSIHGGMYSNYDWRFCFIFQQDRIDILKKVYGIDAQPIGTCSPAYERFLHNRGFMAIQHINLAKRLFDAVHAIADPEKMSEEQKKAYALCWKDYTDLCALFELADQWTQLHYDDSVELSVDEQQQRSEYYRGLEKLEERLRSSGNALNKAFGSPLSLYWTRDIKLWYDKDSVINEVYVNFR